MMYTLFYQNRNNELIDLFNIPDCVVTNVTGLGMVGKTEHSQKEPIWTAKSCKR